jgi:hypothetical protein
MNIRNGCNRVTHQYAINDCLRGSQRHLEIGTNARKPATPLLMPIGIQIAVSIACPQVGRKCEVPRRS